MVLHNVKSMDQIWFEFKVEFKQFNAAVRHYIETSENFEVQMIAKEEEIMDSSL